MSKLREALTELEEVVLTVDGLNFWQVIDPTGAIRVLKFEQKQLTDLIEEHKCKLLRVLRLCHSQVYDATFAHKARSQSKLCHRLTGSDGLLYPRSIESLSWTCLIVLAGLSRSAWVARLHWSVIVLAYFKHSMPSRRSHRGSSRLMHERWRWCATLSIL
jgi:hypothetical protein